jgi:hypothetical protein
MFFHGLSNQVLFACQDTRTFVSSLNTTLFTCQDIRTSVSSLNTTVQLSGVPAHLYPP